MRDLRRQLLVAGIATAGLFLMDLASNLGLGDPVERAVLGALLTCIGYFGARLWGISGQGEPPPRRRP